MKKMIFAILVMIIFCSNVAAVYHKIGHYTTGNIPVDGELIDNNLIILELDKFTVLNINNSLNPEIISQTFFNIQAQDILIQDNIAYIGGLNRINIYDLSDLENPLYLSTVNIIDYCVSLSIYNNMLYASCGQGGLYFIDISDPQLPLIETHYDNFLCTTLIDIKWPIMFVQLFDTGLIKLLNIEDPENIEIVGEIMSLSEEFIISNDVLYINAEQNHINLFDVSNPFEPIQLSSLEGVGCPLIVVDEILYTRGNGIDVFQIDENFELSPLGMYDSWAIVEGFEVIDGIAFDITRWEGLQILDLSDPIEENCIGSCELFNTDEIPICPVDINLYEDALYLSYDSNEMAGIIDISNFEDPIYQQFPNQENHINSFALWNDVLFAKDWYNIYTYNLSNPFEPQLLGTFENLSGSKKILTIDDLLIEFDYSNINTYSIENSTQITEMESYEDIGYKTAFEANNGYIYYSIYQEGIRVIDIENRERTDFYPIDGFIGGMNINDNILYVSSENEIILLDITDPTSIEYITSIQPHEDSEFIAPIIIDGNDLIIADASWNEISVYDITNPTMPTLIYCYSGCREVREMVLKDDYLLTSNNRSGFAIISLVGLLEYNENEINSNYFNLQNYPNPFNPTTTINFSLQTDTKVDLIIYNIKGQKIKTLISSYYEKGNHSIIWDGLDEFGNSVSSGIYIYNLKTKDNQKTSRMLLLK